MSGDGGIGSGAALGAGLVSADEFARTVDERIEEAALTGLDAAMYWHMQDEAFSAVPGFLDDVAVKMAGDVDSGWVAAVIAPPAAWVRRYPSPTTGATPTYEVQVGGVSLPLVDVDDRTETDVAPTILENLRSELHDAFRKWRSMPAPEVIVNQVVVPIMDGMYLVSGGPSAFSTAPAVLANKDYLGLLAAFDDATPHLKGVAMDYFKAKYVRQLDAVIPNLQFLMGELGKAALGNAVAIQRARAAVLAILDDAIVAMGNARPGKDYTGLKVAVAIVGAVVAAAATFVTAGTGTAFAVGLGGGTISALSGTIPDDSTPPQVSLGAEKPAGVLDNIIAALTTADDELLTEEQAAAYLAFDQHDRITAPIGPGQPDPFHLEEPDETTGRLVQADRTNMAVLWDTLPQIATRLRQAAAKLDNAAGSREAFHHGAVGRSADGAQPDIKYAADEVWSALRSLADDLDEGAQGLKDLWRDFSDADGLTRAEFDAIKKELV